MKVVVLAMEQGAVEHREQQTGDIVPRAGAQPQVLPFICQRWPRDIHSAHNGQHYTKNFLSRSTDAEQNREQITERATLAESGFLMLKQRALACSSWYPC